MNNDQYIKRAKVTEGDYSGAQQRLAAGNTARLLHAGMGLATEGGEILDALKKHIYYGTVLDTVNLKEEAGDLMWYLAVLIDALGLTFEQVQNANIAKLFNRYGEKFSKHSAIERDLFAEREVLEKSV
jgi:NTP pyrophosphatase (non-canonical NTP hydrolase)